MIRKYNKIMDHIKVTDEMSERILNNIDQMNINGRKTVIKMKFLNRIMASAACLVLTAAVISLIYYVNNRDLIQPPDNSSVHEVNGIIEMNSSEELSEVLGFDVNKLEYLPFKTENIKYYSYFGNMAQIDYSDENKSIKFRQSRGSDDNSGDYTEYVFDEMISIGGKNVNVKGMEKDRFCLAVWQLNDMSYSVKLSDGVDLDKLEKILFGIK